MGYRYQQPSESESAVSFRVVEIFMVNDNRGKSAAKGRFLLVDNRQETLEVVQRGMQEFVKTAILANRLGKVIGNENKKI